MLGDAVAASDATGTQVRDGAQLLLAALPAPAVKVAAVEATAAEGDGDQVAAAPVLISEGTQ
jgi:hypothetical protein